MWYAGLVVPPQELVKLGYELKQLDCAGLKLTLCEVYKLSGAGRVDLEERTLPQYIELEPSEGGVFRLGEGAYVIRYCEYVKVPEDSMAIAIQRSTLLRSGVALFSAVWDPGYEGRGFGLMVVFNGHGVEIRRGAQVAQLVYVKLAGRSALPYRGTYYGER